MDSVLCNVCECKEIFDMNLVLKVIKTPKNLKSRDKKKQIPVNIKNYYILEAYFMYILFISVSIKL